VADRTPIAAGSWSSVYEATAMTGPEPGSEPEPTPVAVKFMPTGTVTQRQLAHLADMTRREQEAHRRLRQFVQRLFGREAVLR
jgi:hypothetical protein